MKEEDVFSSLPHPHCMQIAARQERAERAEREEIEESGRRRRSVKKKRR